MIKIQTERIDVNFVKDFLKGKESGAIVMFLGEPRSAEEDGNVVSINYTAYGEMAIKEMERIEREAHGKFSVNRVVIFHRLGNIPLKEISFLVAVSSAHRKEAFEACEWIVNEVKRRVPIWKEIIYERSRNSKQDHK